MSTFIKFWKFLLYTHTYKMSQVIYKVYLLLQLKHQMTFCNLKRPNSIDYLFHSWRNPTAFNEHCRPRGEDKNRWLTSESQLFTISPNTWTSSIIQGISKWHVNIWFKSIQQPKHRARLISNSWVLITSCTYTTNVFRRQIRK